MSGEHPDFVLIAGPNGAGKSTVGVRILQHACGIMTVLNADIIASGMNAGNPASEAWQAAGILLNKTATCVAARKSFAVETTLAARSYSAKICNWKEEGYRFHLIYLYLNDPQLALLRVRGRVMRGGHNIPSVDVVRRYYAGLRNLVQEYIPLADIWFVCDNSEQSTLSIVAQGTINGPTNILQSTVWNHILLSAAS